MSLERLEWSWEPAGDPKLPGPSRSTSVDLRATCGGADPAQEASPPAHLVQGPAAQVGCMRQVHGPGALGRPRGTGWRGRREGGLGWGIHVTPWLIHVSV